MIFCDLHLHTTASPDGEATAEALVAAARARGLTHIALTDHYEAAPADPRLFAGDTNERWFAAACDRYRAVTENAWVAASAAKTLAGDSLVVLRGLELGSPLDDLSRTEEILAVHPYDFLLGSVHANRGRPDFYYLSQEEGVDFRKELETYFEGLLSLIGWGRFHALAHLTYPFRYLPADHPEGDLSRWGEEIRAVLRRLAEAGLSLEINTSSVKKGGDLCPNKTVLGWFLELGGELVTVGSDAHRAEHLADGFSLAEAEMKAAGLRYLTVYQDGVPYPLPF